MNVHSVSLKGKRNQNEDKHIVQMNCDGKNTELNNINMFGVFDGHGGKDVSKFIRTNIPKYFTKKGIKYPITRKYIENVHDHLQQVLKKNHSAIADNMGTTSLIVLHYKDDGDEYLNVINVGDSRCVLCSCLLYTSDAADE